MQLRSHSPAQTLASRVQLTPNTSGAQMGTLTVTDNAPNSPQTVSLAGNQPANFTLSAGGGSSASATISPGQVATYNLSLTGSNGFSGAINLACSGAPTNSICRVMPNPANVSGTGAVAVMVSVSTTAESAVGPVNTHCPGRPLRIDPLLVLAASGLGALSWLGIRRRNWAWAAVALCIALVAAGCGSSPKTSGPGSSGSNGTAAGQI